MNKLIQYKPFEIKGIDLNQGTIEAYVSIFDVVDSDNDIIRKGAFTKSIQERGPGSQKPRIKHLWQHDSWQPIGIPIEMTEDNKGLLVVSQFGSDSFSQEKLKLHADGIISEYSIGFQVIKQETPDGMPRILTELKLWEYSSVTWGANEWTHTVKSMDKTDALDYVDKKIDVMLKALKTGTYTDDSYTYIEYRLKQLYTLMSEVTTQQPVAPTQQPDTKGLADYIRNYKF